MTDYETECAIESEQAEQVLTDFAKKARKLWAKAECKLRKLGMSRPEIERLLGRELDEL